MATYQVELTDGRAFEVEADAPPSESDLLSALGESSPNVGFDDRTAQGPMADEAGFKEAFKGMGPKSPSLVDTIFTTLLTPPHILNKGITDLTTGVGAATAAVGNLLFDRTHGLPNMLLHAAGREGFPTEQQVFGSPEYAKGQAIPVPKLFNVGQPVVDFQALMPGNGPDAAHDLVTQTLSSFTSPEMLTGLLMSNVKTLKPAIESLFLSQTVPATIESGAKVLDSSNDTTDRLTAGLETVLSAAFTAALSKALAGKQPGPSGIGPGDIQTEGLRFGDQPLLGPPKRETSFVVDPLGRVQKAADVDPFAGQTPYQTVEPKKAFQGEVPILGEKQAQVGNKFSMVIEDPKTIVPANQAFGESKQGGQISFDGQGIPNARQATVEQAPLEVLAQEIQQRINGPDAQSYRAPKPAPTAEEYARQKARASVEEGLTQPSGMYVGSETLPYAKEGQYPAEGGPQGTLSNLQRSRIQAGQPNVRTMQNNNPPGMASMADALAKAEAERVAREVGAKQGANDDASLPASGKMISGEGQSSTPQAKGPQIEDANAGAPIESRGPQGGNISSLGFLDPAFWKSQIGIAKEAKVDAKQLYNRMRNKLGEDSATWKMLEESEGFKTFMTGVKSPGDVERWVETDGPKVEVHAYGMEGKLNDLQKEYADIRHWRDGLSAKQREAIDEAAEVKYNFGPASKRMVSVIGDVDAYLARHGLSASEIQYAHRYNELLRNDEAIKPASGLQATSAYSSVSPFPTTDPMPEWTKSKEGKNVQRVDVVVPLKGELESNSYSKRGMRQADLHDKGMLWSADNLHENLPNTLGWAMVQYKTGPKGERIAVVAEAQSRWGQSRRKEEAYIKSREDAGTPIRPDEKRTADHPLLRDYNRLILKAAIDQARKEGATHIVVSDSKTAMLSETLDSEHTFKGPYPNKSTAEFQIRNNDSLHEWKPFQHGDQWYISDKQGGFDFNYDVSMPKIAEELTGSKGERVTLGEHKNAYPERPRSDYATDEGHALAQTLRKPRGNLIFRNADGTPKTDVSGMMYELKGAREDFSYTGKDKAQPKAESPPTAKESPRLYMNPVGPMLKQTGKDVKDLGKAVTGIVKKGISSYSEPLVERLGTLGGPVSKAVAREAGDIVSKQKKYYGELTTVVDDAKREVGKLNPASTWLRGKVNVTDRAATGNMFAHQEGKATVPPGAQAMVGKLDVANRAIGQMGMSIGSGGTASGKFQRMLNSYGVDVVRRGTGPAWEAWVDGVAKANNRPLAETQRFFRRWKDEMDAPGTDVASLNKISQDFVRKYPNTVSHIKVGHAWHEVLVADAFAYLEGAAQRTAAAKAFREKYPVDSGLLAATRKAVQKELQTDKHMKEFDNLIRALQGHPTDALINTLTAPDTLVGGGARMLGQVVGNPIKSLMLTGNVVTNLAEVITGGPSIFLGYRNAMRAMWNLPDFYTQLELNGAVNRLMMNYAYDPSSPVRSVARMFSNGVRRATAQAMLNELQEAQAAMSAKLVADSVKNGTLPRNAQEKLIATMRMMGFEEQVARDVIRNPNEDVLGQFERRASAALTSGHIAMAERSRLGTSRAFNELFWFHSYPQMTLNQLRAVWKNLATDIEKKNVPQAKANAVLLGRLIGGRTMQGALTTGVYALAFGGMFGLGMQKKKAQEETGEFLVDSLIGGFGGPAAIAKRMIERGGTSKDVVSSIATLSTPVSVSAELYDMGMGNAKYEGKDAFDRVGTFVASKSPGYKMLKAGMSMWGLAEGNPELDAARKEFYIWRQKTMGSKSMTFTGDEEGDKVFRAQMRKAVKTLEAGGDWRKELAAAGDPDRASKSLYARTVLKTPEGKPLNEEQLGELTKRIGLAAVDKMQHYDAMVREVARELGEPAKGEQKQVKDLELPTGKFAVDQKTPMQRNAAVKGGLSKESQAWLDENGVRLNDAKPETKRGKQVTLMLKDQGKELEAEMVKETEGLIKQLSGRASWERKSTQEKQEYFNERMNQLEKRAKFRLRNKTQPKQ